LEDGDRNVYQDVEQVEKKILELREVKTKARTESAQIKQDLDDTAPFLHNLNDKIKV